MIAVLVGAVLAQLLDVHCSALSQSASIIGSYEVGVSYSLNEVDIARCTQVTNGRRNERFKANNTLTSCRLHPLTLSARDLRHRPPNQGSVSDVNK